MGFDEKAYIKRKKSIFDFLQSKKLKKID